MPWFPIPFHPDLFLVFAFVFRQANRPPAKLNLLTCQVKTNPEEKKCFDLISRKLLSQTLCCREIILNSRLGHQPHFKQCILENWFSWRNAFFPVTASSLSPVVTTVSLLVSWVQDMKLLHSGAL